MKNLFIRLTGALVQLHPYYKAMRNEAAAARDDQVMLQTELDATSKSVDFEESQADMYAKRCHDLDHAVQALFETATEKGVEFTMMPSVSMTIAESLKRTASKGKTETK